MSGTLNRTVVILLIVYGVGSVASMFRSMLFTLAGQRLVARLRKDLFTNIVIQEIAFFDTTRFVVQWNPNLLVAVFALQFCLWGINSFCYPPLDFLSCPVTVCCASQHANILEHYMLAQSDTADCGYCWNVNITKWVSGVAVHKKHCTQRTQIPVQ